MNNLIVGVGELDICDLCDSSPHETGCPMHPTYDDDVAIYVRSDAPDERGTARFWVEDTFAMAAADDGLDQHAALIEGVQEFRKALQRAELRVT